MLQRPRVLNPEEVPDQELILHRGNHLDDVSRVLDRMQRGHMTTPFLLHGPPGTGKTMVARHALAECAERDDVRTAYVDCWHDYDTYHLLCEVVDGLELTMVHRNATPHSALEDTLLAEADRPRIVVLDEVEMVHDPAVLKTLADAPQLSVVGIVNDPETITDTLATAWDESLPENQRLEFRSYSVQQLAAILEKRAAHALADGAMTDGRAEGIGSYAQGDARLGICILREAAEHCYRMGISRIERDHVQEAADRTRRQLYEQRLDRLTDHQRALYDVIRASDDGLSPAVARERYCERVDDPRSLKTVRKYLQKMVWYDLLETEGTTRDKVYRVDTTGYIDPELISQ